MINQLLPSPRVVAIMPARNGARTLEDTVTAIPPGCIDQVVLVDNASRDDTVAIAERLGLTVVRHPVDRGFGGSIKTCFRTALDAGADLIVELHPDNQYDPRFIPALIEKIRAGDHAIVIGSRFLPARRALEGGMPWWKFVNNRALTLLNSVLLGVYLSEFHSGLRVYDAKWVRSLPLKEFSDDFTLGFQLVAQAVKDGRSIDEIPAFCRYFDEASQNPLRGSIVYGLGTLSESFKVLGHRLGFRATRLRPS
jgi:glycosyltransferase involved in cell wall biosynthesis